MAMQLNDDDQARPRSHHRAPGRGTRHGATKDDAAWYVINVLDRIGVRVPKLSPTTDLEQRDG